MNNQETIANLNMINAAFVEPVTKEQRKLIDDTFDKAINALSAIDAIKKIINSELPIQEDVMRYKMICEIVKGESE